MSSTRDIRTGAQLSLSTLADAFGMARETIKKRLLDAGVQPSGEVRGHPVYALKDAVRAYLDGFDQTKDPDNLPAFERKAHYQAEHEKLQLQMERGELCASIEVEAEFARMHAEWGRFLDTLPDQVERRGLASPALLEALEELIDEQREALYQRMRGELSDADRAAQEPG